jgi:hypothetical protein
MALQPIKLLSAPVVERLSKDIPDNLERYSAGDFLDLERENGWAIETRLAKWDSSLPGKLDLTRSADAEISNSLLVYQGLEGMTPALAREERLWTRLCHIEFLEYARARWLTTDDVAGAVRLHFFAAGLRGCRDRNALGRLWWNGHVAALASPDNIEDGLRRLLGRANIRLQVIDRADSAFRQPLVSGIVRLLGRDEWFESYDAAIADFMFEVNKRSGGIIFEALDETAIDALLEECVGFAKLRRGA